MGPSDKLYSLTGDQQGNKFYQSCGIVGTTNPGCGVTALARLHGGLGQVAYNISNLRPVLINLRP